jgi:hypothetical protein
VILDFEHSESQYGFLMDFIYSNRVSYKADLIKMVSPETRGLVRKVNKNLLNIQDVLNCETEECLAKDLDKAVPETIWNKMLQSRLPEGIKQDQLPQYLTAKFKAMIDEAKSARTREAVTHKFEEIIDELFKPVEDGSECFVCYEPLCSVVAAPSCPCKYDVCLNCTKKIGTKCFYRHENISYRMEFHE